MPAAIGIRVYMITLHKRGDATPLPFASPGRGNLVSKFIDKFKADHAASVQDADRSWYFEEKDSEGPGCSKGYVHYGMSGFESKIIDRKTRQQKYARKTTDSEETPLFYEFWHPTDGQDYAMVLFQSFQGRSCITLVRDAFRTEFENNNSGYAVYVKKLLPGEMGTGIFGSSLVKRLTLIKRNASGDLASRYVGANVGFTDIEFSVTSRPRKNLGNLVGVFTSINSPDRVMTYDGVSFDEAVADIRVGKRLRRVGIFGSDSEAGVIDITNDVETGSNGHPSYNSIITQANEILIGFHERLFDSA